MQPIAQPDRISSYFKREKGPLILITFSGIIYNIGMTAGPYFEGQLAQRLFDIMQGKRTAASMVTLAFIYLAVILVVQGMRCIKRFYVRQFANDTSRNMRHMIYNSLVHKSRNELQEENIGTVMTKAVSDVDACAEGMRKFTTEIFDTGVVLVAYLVMLFVYDWRLALLSSLFTPIAYVIANQLKGVVTRYNASYKKSAGRLNQATMDRVSNAITYRVYGREQNRDMAYEEHLGDYEKRAVAANLWENTMQPLYHIISMCGAIIIVYFGAKNVLGSGWCSWNIAAFTTFLSCFTKMAQKSSKAAKLFNAVQKAQVSWKRVKPLMQEYREFPQTEEVKVPTEIPLVELSHVSFSYPAGPHILTDISFSAMAGEVIGVTGPVACGKSTLGKLFLNENSYQGSVRVAGQEVSALSAYERSRLITYMGHQPELMSDSIAENISLGHQVGVEDYLRKVCLDQEIAAMPEGTATYVGSQGTRLSGGQQARLALARTLCQGSSVMILDDPFSAVDRQTEQAIWNNIREMSKHQTIILISHRLYLFPEFDHVLWMDQGKAVFSTHDQLLKDNAVYANIYHTQTAGGDLDEAE